MGDLSYYYQKLLDVPGYSFIVLPDGKIVEWDAPEMKARRFDVQRLHVIPGSFNPLHDSHREMFAAIRGAPDCSFFEMSIERVDKPPVSVEKLESRLRQFEWYAPVVVSRASRFIEKIGTYVTDAPLITFHVGIDCITRMKDDYTLIGIQGLGARFVVHSRIMNGELMSLESEFGNDVPGNCTQTHIVKSSESMARSSTAIRDGKSV